METEKTPAPHGQMSTPPLLRDLPNEIPGTRVRLRPYRPGDGAVLYKAVSEDREHLRRWLPWVDKHSAPDASEEIARRMQARWLLREDLVLGIWEQGTNHLLGGSGLHRIDWEVPSFEIGYWLRASAEGQGYITETVRLLCTWAFGTLGAQRVSIQCDSANVRSAAVPQRLGFVHEATLRSDSRSTSGALTDTLVFALTPDDYAKWGA